MINEDGVKINEIIEKNIRTGHFEAVIRNGKLVRATEINILIEQNELNTVKFSISAINSYTLEFQFFMKAVMAELIPPKVLSKLETGKDPG